MALEEYIFPSGDEESDSLDMLSDFVYPKDGSGAINMHLSRIIVRAQGPFKGSTHEILYREAVNALQAIGFQPTRDRDILLRLKTQEYVTLSFDDFIERWIVREV